MCVLNCKKTEVNKKLALYIGSEVSRMNKILDDCPDCIKPKNKRKDIQKRPYIPESNYMEIKKLASRLRMPVQDVINNLIIHPLLQEA